VCPSPSGASSTSQRRPAKRFVSREEALFYGDSWFIDVTSGTCRAGHQAPRRSRTAGSARTAKGSSAASPPFMGTVSSKSTHPPRKPKDPPGVIAAPAAAAAPWRCRRRTPTCWRDRRPGRHRRRRRGLRLDPGAGRRRASANEKFATALKRSASGTWSRERSARRHLLLDAREERNA